MANSWWEIKVFSEPTLEDSIFWRLENFGARGISSQVKSHSNLVCAYLPAMEVQLLDLAALALWLRQDALCLAMPVPVVKWHLIDEEDWSSSWKQHWQPQEVGDRFLVYPAWLPIPEPSERMLLRLDPGAAFGTGTHATTQLCLEALEMRLGSVPTSFFGKQEEKASLIADIGTGSGILSIGAILLGAHKVYAVDNDSVAVKAARNNRDLNQISSEALVIEKGSIQQLQKLLEQPVDGIVCNILAEVIIDLIPQMNAITKSNSWGILSGILLDQVKPIADTLEQNGWTIAALWKRQDWCCFNIRRS